MASFGKGICCIQSFYVLCCLIEHLLFLSNMEKLSWKAVKHNDKNGHLPNLRWGHSCALLEDEVVFFGGYADSNYMNDLWTFNTITMEWTQISTTGDVPSHRSNCTMHYDKDNDRLILFGGGGANKQRFNSISLLNWKTKQWIEISPKCNEPAPWARTYHTSQLFYPYLVVHGGQGITDMDDLWVFNFLTMSWLQIPAMPSTPRPCARRFHSSARIGNQFFIVAGCHSKYRCLSDIYSIDLTPLIDKGTVEGLQWRERRMKDNTFLTRWGHTSTVYQNKIYVFGGRFCNDLNDILVLDPQKDQIFTAKIAGDSPKARRRHSACFLGSSMLIFGGFNGQYFNDLHYINITESKKRFFLNCKILLEDVESLKQVKTLEWQQVLSSEGTSHSFCKGLLASRFASQQSMDNFLQAINEQFTLKQLKQLAMTLYNGYGNIQSQLVYQYGISIADSKVQMEQEMKANIVGEERQSVLGKRAKNVQSTLVLEDSLFRLFIQNKRNSTAYSDVVFDLKNECQVRSNRALLSLSSPYFKMLISGNYLEKEATIAVPFNDSILFEIMLTYLTSGLVVTSKDYGHEFWVMLGEMAEYYSLEGLLSICQQQLITKVTEYSCQELLVISLEMGMALLARSCADQIIRNMINQEKEEITEVFPEVKSQQLSLQREQVLKEVYGTLRFDILQKKIESEERQAKNSYKLMEEEQTQEEKENNQIAY